MERYDNELPVLGDFVLWVLPEDVRKHFKREAYSLRIDSEYLDTITGKVKTKSDLRNFLRRYSDIYGKLKKLCYRNSIYYITILREKFTEVLGKYCKDVYDNVSKEIKRRIWKVITTNNIESQI